MLDADISQDLPILEADHDANDIPRDDARNQFTKPIFTFPLPKGWQRGFADRGTLGAQFRNVALYGSGQLYPGGMDTIRGFRSGGIVGDRGFLLA